jgi:hypothetical protein
LNSEYDFGVKQFKQQHQRSDSAISGSTGSTDADYDPIHPSQCKQ